MKNATILILAICISIFSCTKQTSTTPVHDPIDTSKGSMSTVLKHHGSFKNGQYGRVTGTASIYEINGKWELRLMDFKTSNGPDLKVYLSKEVQPLNFIKLGDLKSTSGNQVYPIQGRPDIMQYKFALIHCEQYNHLFGSAELMKP